MKILYTILLFYIPQLLLGQNQEIRILYSDGMVSYVDNTPQAQYSISFRADTMIITDNPDAFFIDNSLFQILKQAIPQEFYHKKSNPKEERFLLTAFKDYEFNYQKKEVFKKKITEKSEFFTNDWGKQFLLWYYEMPKEMQSEKSEKLLDGKLPSRSVAITHQLYLNFIANSYNILISQSVAENEKLEDKIAIFKKEIANSIRIYETPILFNALKDQIDKKLKGENLVITDSIAGIKFTIPFWLNVQESKYILSGSFPDINNISNALFFNLFEKSSVNSFQEFQNRFLKNPNIVKVNKSDSKIPKSTCYEINYNNKTGAYKCDYVFFETQKFYGLIIFTATPDTYNKNWARYNEFLNNFHLLE